MLNAEDSRRASIEIDRKNLPEHIAVIMDGNGRWATARGLPRTSGHRRGVKALKEIVNTALDLNIRYLSVFCFSTENWSRPQEELEVFFSLIKEYFSQGQELNKQGIRLNVIGDITRFDQVLQNCISEMVERSRDNTALLLTAALNYGGRQEIVMAIKDICQQVVTGNLAVEDICEQTVFDNISTKHLPEPDLLIRTGGEYRISNFYLWNLAYTELYFTDTLWPEFDSGHFKLALQNYQKRERRFGKLK